MKKIEIFSPLQIVIPLTGFREDKFIIKTNLFNFQNNKHLNFKNVKFFKSFWRKSKNFILSYLYLEHAS